jgi:hypothetical protein
MELNNYLDDLESRIDINEERRIIEEWREFVMRRAPGSVFSPSRKPAPPSALDWPAVNVNDAILDESYETMLLSQLRGVNGVISNDTGSVPMMRANYGSTILPTLFGCKLQLMDYKMNTLPGALHVSGGEDAVRKLLRQGIPELTGGQGRHVVEASLFFVEKLAPYPKLREAIRIYHPDLQGSLDIAEVVYGSEIFLAFYDEPELMSDFLDLVTETYIAFADHYFSQLPPSEDFNFHYGWLHRGKIRISLDSCVNFSPEMYREFILPCDQRLFNRYGGVVHSCGKVDHFVDVLPELGAGYHGFNLSQPHLNNMDKVFAATHEQGIRIFGLQPSAAQAATEAGRDLRGLVHSPIECNPDSSKLG